MSDEAEPDGGEGGGAEHSTKLVLSRTDLAVFRKHASKFGFVDGERQEACELVMDTMRIAKSLKTKLAAVRTMEVLERHNLAELKLYLDSTAKPLPAPSVVVNNQVVVNNELAPLTMEQILVQYADVIETGRAKDAPPQKDDLR